MPINPRSRLALVTFAAALVLLVANDTLLKGQGTLPSWLTGKLSDFAGLIVAPTVLAFMTDARGARAQLCGLVAIGGVFTLTEVSPACAELVEQATASLGIGWRLWPDLSDLVALGVLPLSWFCCRALCTRARSQSSGGSATRCLMLAACVACLGSGRGTFSARAYVYNASRDTAVLEVSTAWVNCSDLSVFEHDFLQREDFVSQGSFQLEPGTVLPLDEVARGAGAPSRVDPDCMCPLLRVSASGRTVNVYARGLSVIELVRSPDAKELAKARGQLVVLRDVPAPIEIGAALETFELAPPGAEAPSPAACSRREPPVLDFSVPAELSPAGVGAGELRDASIVGLEQVAGSCFELELASVAVAVAAPVDAGDAGRVDFGFDAEPWREAPVATLDAGAADAGNAELHPRDGGARVQICAPRELFPFEVGDHVDVRWTTPNTTSSELLDIQNQRARFKLTRALFYSGEFNSSWEGFEARIPAVRCGPWRDAEGALFESIDVAYAGHVLTPGRSVVIRGGPREIYLGRARRHLGRACGIDESWLEVVERWTY